MTMKPLILLLALLTLSGCKTTYNYIVITPVKETKKTEINPNPTLDRWNCFDARELKHIADSVYNRIKVN